MMFRLLLLLLTLFYFSPCIDAEPEVHVTAVVDRDVIHVGDPVVLTITATAPEDIRVVMPGDQTPISPFKILTLDRKITKADSGSTSEELILHVSTYDVGDYEIPSMEIVYQKSDGQSGVVTTEPIAIKVKSVLESTDTNPRDVKNPMEVEAAVKYRILFLTSLLVLIAAIASFFWWRHQRKLKLSKAGTLLVPPTIRPGYEIALEALETLSAKGYIGLGQFKSFFIELIEIYKTFLQDRYAVPFIERTTGEIKKDLNRIKINETEKAEIMNLFELADLVKFAKFQPAEHTSFDAFNRVEQFIRRVQATDQAGRLMESVSATPELERNP